MWAVYKLTFGSANGNNSVRQALSLDCAASMWTPTVAIARVGGVSEMAAEVSVERDAAATVGDNGAVDNFLSWPCKGEPWITPDGDTVQRAEQGVSVGLQLCRDRQPATQLPDAAARPLGAEATPAWPLCVYTLGRFRLVRDGCELSFHGKSPRKPLDLLLALIALGAHKVHTDALMRAVWPGEASTDLRNLFDNTLHRLRHLLGCPALLPLSDARLSLDTRQCWVDALAFDRLVAAPIDRLGPSDAHDALRLYQGHFLQGDSARPWAAVCRERLRSRLHRFLIAAGQRLELAGRHLDAVELYERGLEVDPLAEDLYQRLMDCHQRLGQHAESLRVYRRCRDLLAAELGLAPSRATREAALHAAV